MPSGPSCWSCCPSTTRHDPTVFKLDPLFLDGNTSELLEAALPDVIISDDSSDEEFILTADSKATLKATSNSAGKHLFPTSAHTLCGPGSAIDLSYKSYHPYAHSQLSFSVHRFRCRRNPQWILLLQHSLSITTEHRKDAFVEASHSQLAQISRKYQHELSSIVDMLIARGPEKMGPKLSQYRIASRQIRTSI